MGTGQEWVEDFHGNGDDNPCLHLCMIILSITVPFHLIRQTSLTVTQIIFLTIQQWQL